MPISREKLGATPKSALPRRSSRSRSGVGANAAPGGRGRGIVRGRARSSRFGGGGPLSACALADLLGMKRRFSIPPRAGALERARAADRAKASRRSRERDAQRRGCRRKWFACCSRQAREARGETQSAKLAWHARSTMQDKGTTRHRITKAGRRRRVALEGQFAASARCALRFRARADPVEVVAVRVSRDRKAVPVKFASGKSRTVRKLVKAGGRPSRWAMN